MNEALYTMGNYSIKVLSKDNYVIVEDTEHYFICKYSRYTKDEAYKEMISDLIDFLIEDKLAKRRDERTIAADILMAIAGTLKEPVEEKKDR